MTPRADYYPPRSDTHVRSRPVVRAAVLVTSMLTLLGLLLGGCASSSEPDTPTVQDVTVAAGGHEITIPAAFACVTANSDDGLACADTAGDTPHLTVPQGDGVDVTVPDGIADQPWVIVFEYVDAHGDQQQQRTAVFPPNTQSTYRLNPPAGAQLTRLEVQTITAAPATTGGVSFPVTGAWAVTIDPPATTTGPSSQGSRS